VLLSLGSLLAMEILSWHWCAHYWFNSSTAYIFLYILSSRSAAPIVYPGPLLVTARRGSNLSLLLMRRKLTKNDLKNPGQNYNVIVLNRFGLTSRPVLFRAEQAQAGTKTHLQRLQFFPELNEPARPAAARPVSHDEGGQAAGGSAVRTEQRGQDRRNRRTASMIGRIRSCRVSHGGNSLVDLAGCNAERRLESWTKRTAGVAVPLGA
jgi:hypothetical protein